MHENASENIVCEMAAILSLWDDLMRCSINDWLKPQSETSWFIGPLEIWIRY